VSVLLAGLAELAGRSDAGNRAFLFTGEEETGLRGAKAFYEYARANGVPIRAVVNFDNLGRGKLAIRPSANVPGYVFTVPLLGDFAYDGRMLLASPPYALANGRLTQSLLRVQPDLVVYERFTAVSDSNVFEANGIDTVAISGDDMHYLELTWHTYDDRIELLDERNLERAHELILQYAGS
jgi:Zn-dependent M28 family amino/carboxypeptidase